MRRLLQAAGVVLMMLIPLLSKGQSGISLYHMGNATIQGSHFNPSFIPEGKLFFGVPVLSGISFDYNSRISYSDVVIKEGGKKLWNTDGFASRMKNRNYVSIEAEVSTFYLGVRANETTAYSLFVNDKFGIRSFFSKDIIDLALEGNRDLVGKEIDLSKIAGDARYYREIGLGYWKDFPKQNFTVGARLKYIVGFLNASSSNNFDGKVTFTNDNFNTNFDFSNATFNTSGVDLFSDGSGAAIQSHLIGNGNTGFGLDLGANWKITKEISAAVALNDFGFINWKVDTKNYSIQDTTFNYSGITLKDIDDFEQTLEDSLSGRFQDFETANSYRTALNTRFYSSMSYQLDPNSKVTATIANHGVSRRLRMLYGVGYTRKFGQILTVSGNVVKAPQTGFDLGLGYTVDLGAFQFYMATDKILGLGDATKLNGLDLRFGINFIIGRKKKGDSKLEEGDRKGGENIYQKIPLQKPNPIYEKKDFREV
ncbi:MAG: hypothetical protein JXQ96_04210 [Cyclobacteriaceae bacterium]